MRLSWSALRCASESWGVGLVSKEIAWVANEVMNSNVVESRVCRGSQAQEHDGEDVAELHFRSKVRPLWREKKTSI
jgi:hypothetical protein